MSASAEQLGEGDMVALTWQRKERRARVLGFKGDRVQLEILLTDSRRGALNMAVKRVWRDRCELRKVPREPGDEETASQKIGRVARLLAGGADA